MFSRKLVSAAGFILAAALLVLTGVQHYQLLQLREKAPPRTTGPHSGSTGQAGPAVRFNLPAPPVKGTGETAGESPGAKAAESKSLFQVPKLSIAQAEAFVAANQRSAASLAAAFRTSGGQKFLTEAMEKYPGDPQVAFEALFKADLSPAERRQWIEALKQAVPGNSLGHYLSAQDYFKSGRSDSAVGELEAAFGKPGFDDLTLERMQSNEEAYRSSGFPEAQSHNAAMFQLDLPLLKEMNSLKQNMAALSRSYQESGDGTSAEATVAIALKLGDQFRNGGNALLVHQQLGIGIGEAALQTLDPDTVFGPSGQTPRELLKALQAHQAELTSLVRETVPLQERMTPQDWIAYTDRMKLLGEPNAMRWLRAKFAPP